MNRFIKIAAGLLLGTSAAHAQIFTWTTAGDKVGNSEMASMIWLNSYGLGDCAAASAKLKARSAGMRCLYLAPSNHAIFNEAADMLPGKLKSLWWPTGIAKAAASEQTLVAQLSAAAVQPDMFVLDNEDTPNRYSMTTANIAAVAADPRGRALGVFALQPWDETNGVLFDTLTNRLSRAAIQQGIFAPLSAYAPSATTVQWCNMLITASEGQIVRDINDHALMADTIAGNAQNVAIYGTAGINPQTQTPYGVAIYSENLLRVAMNHGPTWPWYGGDNIDGTSSWRNTNYWGEAIRHGLLTCGMHGLLFDASQPTAAAKFSTVYLDVKQAIGGTLPTTMCSGEMLDPAAPFYVTARADSWDGVTPANRVVGRVTFSPGVATATFTVAGRTFTATPAAGQSGAWFNYTATSKTTLPVKKTTTTKTLTPSTTGRTTPSISPGNLARPVIIPH